MSLLVHYTLKSASDKSLLVEAMTTFVDALKAEAIAGLTYSCFSTDDPVKFVGVLEFPDEATKAAFVASSAFETYRATVASILASPPEAKALQPIGSTRG